MKALNISRTAVAFAQLFFLCGIGLMILFVGLFE